MGNNDVTLLANWISNPSHKISYNQLNGATHSNPTSYIEGTSVIYMSNPSSISGYSFKGWSSSTGSFYSVTYIDPSTETYDVDVYAFWDIIYTLVFTDSSDRVIDSYTITKGSPYGNAPYITASFQDTFSCSGLPSLMSGETFDFIDDVISSPGTYTFKQDVSP